MEEKDWQQEQERLEWIKALLSMRIAKLEPEVSGLWNQATDIRKRFWEEVTLNTSTYEDFEESFYTINQQSALLAERERSHKLLTEQWNNLKRLLPSPYFGRLDFKEAGLEKTEQIYIGVSSFVDEDGLNFLIYDWRTPIASMYYDYSPGWSAYLTPAGQIEGDMELKRQYQIQNGKIHNMFDANETIRDEILQQVLGKGANPQMKSIVATIQKEQNTIIRDDKSRMLIVQGVAGSGKTSVALQRIAYLLYKHRQTIRADQIVLFSPNAMFGSYISTVLPDLGEENMQQATFQEYLDYWLGSSWQLEDPFEQMEYILTAHDDPEYGTRMAAIKYKASEAFLHAIERYAIWLGQEGMQFNNICFKEREIITAKQMKEKFYSYKLSLPLSNRISLLQEWLLEQLPQLERIELNKSWVDDELQYLDTDHFAEVFGLLHKDREVLDIAEQFAIVREKISHKNREDEGDFRFAQKEEVLLRRKVVKEKFKPLRRSIKKFSFVDLSGMYKQLFDNAIAYHNKTNATILPELWIEICDQTKQSLANSKLFYEDATPYLYLKELIEGTRTNTEIRYVFIDEGQDYSAFQYEYLKKLFPKARMTVLGDFGQAIFMQSTSLDTANSQLIRLYGEADTTLFRLLQSYRSTKEIVDFTRSMLLDGEEITSFERSGEKPLLTKCNTKISRNAQIIADIKKLQASSFKSIAVITKTEADSRVAYEAIKLQGCETVQLITKETLSFDKGVMVIPVYLAKGVEFDAVLIYDASSKTYSQESERKLLYTACTRAMHQLNLYSTDDWSKFINALPGYLYEVASN